MRTIKLHFLFILLFCSTVILLTASGETIETKNYIRTDNYTLYKNPDTGVVRSITNRKGKGISDIKMKELLKHKEVVTIDLYGGYPFRNSLVQIISNFRMLKGLSIKDGAINDEGLKDIAKIKTLSSLSLNNMQITDKGVKYLEALENLEYIELQNTQITDTSFDVFYRLKKLSYLDLTGTNVSEKATQKFYDVRRKELPGHDVHIYITGKEFY
ncbi:MAG: leucine-rich repeat domain-containing protein [Spirochaetes bacterium]|nr:leucine-rich repeat domain-containing protein [Spirochaetota bacterium]